MNIYVTRRIPKEGLEMLKEAFGEFDMNPHDRVLTREELLNEIKGRDGVLSLLTDNMDAEAMDAIGSQCKVISNYAVGYNNVRVDAASERGIMVTNTPGVLDDATADCAISLLFSAARRIVESDEYMRSEKFQGWAPMLLLGKEVTGATLGIIGAGRIGTNMAKKMAAFDMKILYADPSANEELDAMGATHVDLETLCRESDYISIHANLCEATQHLIGEKEFQMMKPTATLINTARGAIIDETALVTHLQNNPDFYVGMDVFEDEPAMKPGLKDCKNAIIIPHLGSATIEARTKMSIMAAANLIDALTDKTPEFLVNKDSLA
ncbi:D-glycerate dehydrogenase [Candidatus Peregrinibacteria bacterium]|jgi:glyoxylate reductase|nr:D-glycerate dehydrogenase [Candidatus Peregrinibacteria bacterium]